MPLMSLAIMTLQPVAGKSALLSNQPLLTLPQASRLGILCWPSVQYFAISLPRPTLFAEADVRLQMFLPKTAKVCFSRLLLA